MIRSSFSACVSFVVVVAILASWHPARSRADDADADASDAPVRVASGALVARSVDGIVAYKGIPYAAPPVGSSRWRAPQPAEHWKGERRADDYGPSCSQPQPVQHVVEGSRALETGEDCLTLNVWTPLARASALPVMVWVHGGGNESGSGSDRYVDGSRFARDGVVLVTFNYRLGPLGFFAHRALAREAGSAEDANFGLLDQIAALRWVRANIPAFGGDRANVTVFGESAGGEDVLALASSPAANGCFERAIAESAGDIWGAWPTLEQARTRGAKLARDLQLPGDDATAAQLRALPAERLVRAGANAGPIFDGKTIVARLRDGGLRNVRVPIVIGTNAGDGSLVSGATNFATFFAPKLSEDDIAFLRGRYAARGISGDADLTARLFGDGYFAAPARFVATTLSTEGQRAYLYRFDYVLSNLLYRRGTATHGSEIPFVFENYPFARVSEIDRSVGAAMHDCWVAFAKTGEPECAAAGTWPPYDVASGKIMVFDARPSVRPRDDSEVLQRLQDRLLPDP